MAAGVPYGAEGRGTIKYGAHMVCIHFDNERKKGCSERVPCVNEEDSMYTEDEGSLFSCSDLGSLVGSTVVNAFI